MMKTAIKKDSSGRRDGAERTTPICARRSRECTAVCSHGARQRTKGIKCVHGGAPDGAITIISLRRARVRERKTARKGFHVRNPTGRTGRLCDYLRTNDDFLSLLLAIFIHYAPSRLFGSLWKGWKNSMWREKKHPQRSILAIVTHFFALQTRQKAACWEIMS